MAGRWEIRERLSSSSSGESGAAVVRLVHSSKETTCAGLGPDDGCCSCFLFFNTSASYCARFSDDASVSYASFIKDISIEIEADDDEVANPFEFGCLSGWC